MRVISSMEQGNRLEGMMRNKRIMFREIYRRVHLLRERPPYRQLPLVEVVQMVVEQPPLLLYDATERHCDHAPHPKTP